MIGTRVGRMRERVEFQRSSQTTNAQGEEVLSWATLATVFAAAESMDARQVLPAEGGEGRVELGAKARVLFRIRYSTDVSGLTTQDRAVWRSGTYDIESVRDVEVRQREMEVVGVKRG